MTIDFAHSQRLSSTTTRIKTAGFLAFLALEAAVRDYLPLQQGLRPLIFSIKVWIVKVRDYLPLQQGLRHNAILSLTVPGTSETIFHYNKD